MTVLQVRIGVERIQQGEIRLDPVGDPAAQLTDALAVGVGEEARQADLDLGDGLVGRIDGTASPERLCDRPYLC